MKYQSIVLLQKINYFLIMNQKKFIKKNVNL